MNAELLQHLDYVSGYRDKRVLATQFVLNHPEYFEELLQLCFLVDEQKSDKACSVLEQVALHQIEWLQPHLSFFCKNVSQLKHESAIRPMAKVSQLLVEAHAKKDG